jgi:hypothetical protein
MEKFEVKIIDVVSSLALCTSDNEGKFTKVEKVENNELVLYTTNS